MINSYSHKSLKKHNLSITIMNILLLSCLIIFSVYSIHIHSFVALWSQIITIISSCLLMYQLVIMYRLKMNYTDFGLWFLLLSNVFMFSRVYLNALNLDENIFWDLLSRYPNELLYSSALIVLCMLQGLFTGYIYQHNKNNEIKSKLFSKVKEKSLLANIYNTGFVLTIISLPFRLMTDLQSIQQAQGASSYLAVNTQSGISDDIGLLFVPGIIYILTGRKSKKRNQILVLSVVLYFLLIMILTGDRRYPVTAIISLVLCYLYLYDIEITFKRLVIYGLSASFLLNLLSIIRDVRRTGLTSLSNFISQYGINLITNNPVLETLSEFGLSFLSVVGIVKNIPTVIPYQNGLSFYGALPSLLPIGWLFSDFFRRVSISNRISSIERYPVGATLLGDMYANFGWFSILISIISGIILAKVFRISNNSAKQYYVANYFSLFYILINLVRSSFFEIFRPVIYIYLIPLVILHLFVSYRKRRLI